MRKIALLLLLVIAINFAENYVVINSIDGRDVLSGIFYANAKGYPVKFMAYPNGNIDLLAAKVGSGHDILLIQSADKPVSNLVQGTLQSKGNTVQVLSSKDAITTNLDLASKSGTKKFIIVDGAYADSALSVLPYAQRQGAYVLLATGGNTPQIMNLVKNAQQVTVYGYASNSLKNNLSSIPNVVYIGKGEDRYDDNVALAKIFVNQYNISSVLFTEGNFIEDGVATSGMPILFSGRLVPNSTYNFMEDQVKADQIKTVQLLGGTTIAPAVRDMRERIHADLLQQGMNKTFGIWLRYAQAIPGTSYSQASLDIFPLPAYIPRLNITEVTYNNADHSLMVSINNIGEGPAYYMTDIKVQANGQDIKVFGSPTSELLETKDVVGLQYPFDIPSDVKEGNLSATVLVKYGSGKNTMEEYVSYTANPLVTITYTDASSVSVKSAWYDLSKEAMIINLKNNQDSAAFASVDVQLIVDGQSTKVIGPKNQQLDGNTMVPEEVPVVLSDADIAANKNVTIYLKYGGRSGFLVQQQLTTLPFETKGTRVAKTTQGVVPSFDIASNLWLIGGALLVILIIIGVVLYKRRSEPSQPKEEKKPKRSKR